MSNVYVIGAGGHAKVIIATLRACGHTAMDVLDSDDRKAGGSVLGAPVSSTSNFVLPPFAKVIIAIGDNRTRMRVAEEYNGRVEWLTLVHPNADVHSSTALGPGTVALSGSIVQPDVSIGAHGIVSTGATVDHDCVLSDFVHLAPGCHLAGGVMLEDGVFMGISSSVLPGICIGAWSVIGAGATVIRSLPSNITAVGTPARPLPSKV